MSSFPCPSSLLFVPFKLHVPIFLNICLVIIQDFSFLNHPILFPYTPLTFFYTWSDLFFFFCFCYCSGVKKVYYVCYLAFRRSNLFSLSKILLDTCKTRKRLCSFLHTETEGERGTWESIILTWAFLSSTGSNNFLLFKSSFQTWFSHESLTFEYYKKPF